MFNFRLFVMLLVACLLAAPVRDGLSQLRPALPYEGGSEPAAAPPGAVPHSDARSAPTADSERPDANRFYDERNPDYRRLQQAREAKSGLPLDRRGAADWMKALRSGAIMPRADLQGAQRPQVFDLDIILKNTREMPYVRFPHNSHTEWLACSNCHDGIFVPKAGANAITMDKIFRGEYCGTCHDRVAFVTHNACERCHSVPQGNMTPWW